MTIYAYARVSTDGQDLDAQIAALKAAGAVKVFSEVASGATCDRRQLARAVAHLKKGDTLIATRLDRVARSTLDLLATLDAVNKAGAHFRSIHDTWADTTTAHGRLLVAVLGGLAEFERDLIKQRTAEGRAHAKARGVHMGRKSIMSDHQKREALDALANGTAYKSELARRYNVSPSVITRLSKMNPTRLARLDQLAQHAPRSAFSSSSEVQT